MSTPQSQKIADNHAEVPDSVRKASKSIMQDPDKLEAKLDQIDAMKAEGKELGMVDGFLDALSFFIPQALGTLVGTALGGVEAGSHAGNVAGELQGKYLGFKAKQEELGIEQRKLQQQATPTFKRAIGLVNSKTGAGVSFNEKTNTYYEIGTGNIVDIKDVFDYKNDIQERQLSSNLKDQDLRYQKYVLAAQQAGQLNPTELKNLSDWGVALNKLKEIEGDAKALGESQINNKSFIVNRAKRLASSFGINYDGDFTKLNAALQQVGSAYRRAITGAASSTFEMKELAQQLPNMAQNPVQFFAQLEAITKLQKTNIVTNLKTVGTGAPLKANTVNELLKLYDLQDYDAFGTNKKKKFSDMTDDEKLEALEQKLNKGN